MPPKVREHPENFAAPYKPTSAVLPEPLDRSANSTYLNKINDFLSKNCGLTLGTEEQNRLYYANPDGRLYCLEHTDLISEQGRADLVQFARGNRLFAVPAGETTPVQLQLERGDTGLHLQFADGLDKGPERPSWIARKLHEWFPNVKLFASWAEPAESIYQDYMKIRDSVSNIRSERTERGFSNSEQTEAGAAEAKKHDDVNRKAGTELIETVKNCEDAKAMVTRNSTCNARIAELYGAVPYCDPAEARKATAAPYREEDFKKLPAYDIPLAEDSGKHTVKDGIAELQEKDFAALAMFAALNDPSIGKDREDGNFLREELRPSAFATMVTSDLAMSDLGRSGLQRDLNAFFDNPIRPAREAALKAVTAYQSEEHDLGPLADLVASGLEAYHLHHARMPQGKSTTASMAEQAACLLQLMEDVPGLRAAVEEKAKDRKEAAEARLADVRKEHQAFLDKTVPDPEKKEEVEKYEKYIGFLSEYRPELKDAPNVQNRQLLEACSIACEKSAKKFKSFILGAPEILDLLTTDAQLHGIENLCGQCLAFDLHTAEKTVQTNRNICSAIRGGSEALYTLQSRITLSKDPSMNPRSGLKSCVKDGEASSPLSAAEKEQCLRQVIRQKLLEQAGALATEKDEAAANQYTAKNTRSFPILLALAGTSVKTSGLSAEEEAAAKQRSSRSAKILSAARSPILAGCFETPKYYELFADPQAAEKTLNDVIDRYIPREKMQELCQKSEAELHGLLRKSSLLNDLKVFPDFSRVDAPQRDLSAVKTEEKERTLK